MIKKALCLRFRIMKIKAEIKISIKVKNVESKVKWENIPATIV